MNRSLLRTGATTLGLYFMGVSLLFVVENFENLDKLPFLSQTVKKKLNNSDWLFQLQMWMMPRPLESHYVTLVGLETDMFPGPCEKRAFIAKLLPRLVEMQPAMIVSDIGFGKGLCGDERKETKDLKLAIRTAVKTTPLVIAQGGDTLEELPNAKVKELIRLGFQESDIVLTESIDLPRNDNLRLGLIALNADRKKIPIRWSAGVQSSPLSFEDSLPFAAAKLYRSTFPDQGARLTKLEKDSYHPFLSFLSEADFSVVPAITAMCGDAHIQTRKWTDCGDSEGSVAERKKLHGRILMIGLADDPKDQKSTPAGKLPGYVLQANYVEALLDARAFHPLSLGDQFLLGFIWLCLVELPFWLHDFHTIKALIFSFFISFVVMFIVYYIALVNFSWYVNLGPPSALAIVARVTYQRLEQKTKHDKA